MKRVFFQVKETAATIIAEDEKYITIAKREIQQCRRDIEQFIIKDHFFRDTFEPYTCPDNSPDIIKKMCISSEKANAGPMSAVAGAIAERAVEAMVSKGSRRAIVDNGGDIALFSYKTVTVGIYTGMQYRETFALKLLPENRIIGICTSSGKVGHSTSFGNTDAVVVLSYDVPLADATATVVGNCVNTVEDINGISDILKNIDGITGAIVVIDGKVGLWGEIPQIVRADIPSRLITKGMMI